MLFARLAARLAYAALAVVTTTIPLSVSAQTRAVLELFTSQGCSSCPPADKLFGELAADPGLIVLSLPIDYWDYLGWKDTLAEPRHTARQRAYSKVRGDHEVYTPQVVVNGSLHALGSDKDAIETAIAKSRENPATLALPVKLSTADGRLAVSVAERKDLHIPAEVWVTGLARSITVMIKRGENKGKTITYHNVARRWLKLDDWKGTANTWNVPLPQLEEAGVNSAAVLVQSGSVESPNAILGAAMAQLR
ncbi:MAG TPA: DUF1223 domain-containing protein [Xanthobacteraceae bacterium]|jgi:hypothetical protein